MAGQEKTPKEEITVCWFRSGILRRTYTNADIGKASDSKRAARLVARLRTLTALRHVDEMRNELLCQYCQRPVLASRTPPPGKIKGVRRTEEEKEEARRLSGDPTGYYFRHAGEATDCIYYEGGATSESELSKILEPGEGDVSQEHIDAIDLIAAQIEETFTEYTYGAASDHITRIGQVTKERRFRPDDSEKYRIPDVAFKIRRPSGKIEQWVIEVQRSRPSNNSLQQRTTFYRRQNVNILWIALPRIFDNAWRQYLRDIADIHGGVIISPNLEDRLLTFEVRELAGDLRESDPEIRSFTDLISENYRNPFFKQELSPEAVKVRTAETLRDQVSSEIIALNATDPIAAAPVFAKAVEEAGDIQSNYKMSRDECALLISLLNIVISNGCHDNAYRSAGSLPISGDCYLVWGAQKKTYDFIKWAMRHSRVARRNLSIGAEHAQYPAIDYMRGLSDYVQYLLVILFPELFAQSLHSYLLNRHALPDWAEFSDDNTSLGIRDCISNTSSCKTALDRYLF